MSNEKKTYQDLFQQIRSQVSSVLKHEISSISALVIFQQKKDIYEKGTIIEPAYISQQKKERKFEMHL